jgi:hypothetical protein
MLVISIIFIVFLELSTTDESEEETPRKLIKTLPAANSKPESLVKVKL